LEASSRGRASRAAGWFGDYLEDCGDAEMENMILLEGVTGWARAGGEFVGWMDGYDAACWEGKQYEKLALPVAGSLSSG
jgi:arsenical-resistance protein 2